jgi:hypothetical protein
MNGKCLLKRILRKDVHIVSPAADVCQRTAWVRDLSQKEKNNEKISDFYVDARSCDHGFGRMRASQARTAETTGEPDARRRFKPEPCCLAYGIAKGRRYA